MYSYRVSESYEFGKRQTSKSLTTRNQKNENFENSRAANEGYFHWLKLLMKAFLSFDIRTTVLLVVYLQTLKSLQSL